MFKMPKQAEINTGSKINGLGKATTPTKGTTNVNAGSMIGKLADKAASALGIPLGSDSFLGGFMSGLTSTLANPVLITNGRDNLALADPYESSIITPQNAVSSILSSFFGDTAFTGLMKTPVIQEMTGQLLTTGKVDSSTTKKFLDDFKVGALQGLSDFSAPLLQNVQKQIGLDVNAKDLLSGALGLPGAKSVEDVLKTDPTIAMYISGKKYFIDTDYNSLDSVGKLLDNLGGNRSITGLFDLKTELALMTEITKTIMGFDSDELFDKVKNNYTGGSDPRPEIDYQNYLLESVDNVITESSIRFMERTVQEIGGAKVLDTRPDFIQAFLYNFMLNANEEPSAEIGQRLDAMLTSIDPKWKETIIDPRLDPAIGPTTDLAVFRSCSSDAVACLIQAGIGLTEFIFCDFYPVQDIRWYMKSLYPTVPLENMRKK